MICSLNDEGPVVKEPTLQGTSRKVDRLYPLALYVLKGNVVALILLGRQLPLMTLLCATPFLPPSWCGRYGNDLMTLSGLIREMHCRVYLMLTTNCLLPLRLLMLLWRVLNSG